MNSNNISKSTRVLTELAYEKDEIMKENGQVANDLRSQGSKRGVRGLITNQKYARGNAQKGSYIQ